MEQVPQNQRPRLPPVWPGFVLAAAFLFVEIFFYQEIKSGMPKLTGVLIAIFLASTFYWQWMIYRIHVCLRELSGGAYPIKPVWAVACHFIPFYNFYWVYKWPSQLFGFLKDSGKVSDRLVGVRMGAWLLLSILIGRVFDGAVGMFGIFAAMSQIVRQLRTLEKNSINGESR